MNKTSSTRRAFKSSDKSFKLPTIAAFKLLSFKAKAIVFRDWAKTKDGVYNAGSVTDCALCQFGRALAPNAKLVTASNRFFTTDPCFVGISETIQVLRPSHAAKSERTVIWPPRAGCETTFADLTKRLTTYIKKHYKA